MKRVETIFRLMMAISVLALCGGVVMADPDPEIAPQPPGCDGLCRQITIYSDCLIYGQFTQPDCTTCGANAMCKSGPGAMTCRPGSLRQFVRRATIGTKVCNCGGGTFWVEAIGPLDDWLSAVPVDTGRNQWLCQN